MKKQNENGRIPEDRLSRANKRKKNNTIASILVMTGCLLVLVLVTYVAGILYSWIDSKFQSNAPIVRCFSEGSLIWIILLHYRALLRVTMRLQPVNRHSFRQKVSYLHSPVRS